jgi:hypothetical protein
MTLRDMSETLTQRLTSRVSPLLALLCLAGGATLSTGCDPKENLPIPESGSIRITWNTADEATLKTLKLRALYGKVDPLKPVEVPLSREMLKDQSIPVGIRTKLEALSLQALEVVDPNGRSLYRIQRPELDPIRMRSVAPQQSLIELQSVANDGLLMGKISVPNENFWELPAKTTDTPIQSIMPALIDFFRLDDVSDSLLKLRWAASATEKFHNDLIQLTAVVPAIDQSRLELLLDGFYFPSTFIEDMRIRERELSASPDAGSPELRERIELLQKNIQIAEKFAEQSNMLIIAGLVKIKTLRFDSGEALLKRLFAGKEGTDIAFQQLVSKLGGSFEALLDQEKLRLFDLAVKKKALDFGAALAADIFTRAQDKSMAALIDLLRRFPPSAARDELSQVANLVQGEISVAQLSALLTPIRSKEVLLSLSEQLLSRVKDLSSQQVITLTEQRAPDETRDTLLLMALRQTVKFDNDSMRALLLMATNWTVRSQMCALVLPKIAPLQGKSFANLIQVLPPDGPRDGLVFQGLGFMGSLTPADYAALAQLLVSDTSFWEFLEKGTPRLTPFGMSEAVTTSDLLLSRPVAYRDAFLVKAAEGVTDLSWDNLEELLIRASSEDIRSQIRAIAKSRLPPR